MTGNQLYMLNSGAFIYEDYMYFVNALFSRYCFHKYRKNNMSLDITFKTTYEQHDLLLSKFSIIKYM